MDKVVFDGVGAINYLDNVEGSQSKQVGTVDLSRRTGSLGSVYNAAGAGVDATFFSDSAIAGPSVSPGATTLPPAGTATCESVSKQPTHQSTVFTPFGKY